jgi:hypothetical protein
MSLTDTFSELINVIDRHLFLLERNEFHSVSDYTREGSSASKGYCEAATSRSEREHLSRSRPAKLRATEKAIAVLESLTR